MGGRVNAANQGFIGYLNPKFGSFVIHSMYKKYIETLEQGKDAFIHEIFDFVQRELQLQGKQLPECVWNDDMRYLVFKKNKEKGEAVMEIDNEPVDDDDDIDVVYELDFGASSIRSTAL